MGFRQISPAELNENPFTLIGNEWDLITSGTLADYNTMTASWGHLGIIWGEPSVQCVVRTSRYTFNYLEKNDTFTLSFFDKQYKPALQFCGTRSGRDCDKAAETGLTPMEIDGSVSFKEARLILVCRKVYAGLYKEENFCDKEALEKWYSNGNAMHKEYIGAITAVYVKD
jgi:flavin reductase (DIM6/NTAB) family NADH-FMN oxidoreductase RutF